MNQIDIIRSLYSAPDERSYFADDFIWHVPGHNPVSGDYRNEGYFTVMREKMAPLDEWKFEVKHVMENQNMLVAVIHFTGKRKGRTIDSDGAHIFRMNAESKIVEGWGFAQKQEELDRFFE